MSTVTLVVVVVNGLMLLAAAVMCTLRIVRGPRALDRVVATDVLVAVVIAVAGLSMMLSRNGLLLPIMLSLSLLGFTSTVSVARLIRTRRFRPREEVPR